MSSFNSNYTFKLTSSLQQLFIFAASVAACCASPCAAATPDAPELPIEQRALSADTKIASAARAELRARGRAGLDLLFAAHRITIENNRFTPLAERSTQALRIHAALDEVAAQRDAELSGLYWYTNLDEAKKTAQAEQKPIVSLRLLGKLTDELSCANSRFFRTLLYPNETVAKVLRERYVLHWQSERAAPKITIDFGDGRRLATTITGNSVHYVLDMHGRPVDAIPGLYTPKAFLRQLEATYDVAKTAAKADGPAFAALVRQYHTKQLAAADSDVERDLGSIGKKGLFSIRAKSAGGQWEGLLAPKAPILAEEAAPLALSKVFVERPLLSSMRKVWNFSKPEIPEQVWKELGSLHFEAIASNQMVRETIKRKHSVAHSGSGTEKADPQAVLRNIDMSAAADTALNEYQLHSRIRKILSEATEVWDLEGFNEAIYTSVFLTPKSDNWLGLRSDGIYSAIEGGGIETE